MMPIKRSGPIHKPWSLYCALREALEHYYSPDASGFVQEPHGSKVIWTLDPVGHFMDRELQMDAIDLPIGRSKPSRPPQQTTAGAIS